MTEQTDTKKDTDATDWYSGDHATFGDRLTAAREAQGMTQAKLARQLGVKLKTVQAWENDASEPRANKLQMVAGMLNVSIRWLLTGEGDGVSEPATTEELAEGAQALLHDMQTMRSQIAQISTQLGKTEKKLRIILKEVL